MAAKGGAQPQRYAPSSLTLRVGYCPVSLSPYSGRVMLAWTRSPLPASFCARAQTS